MNVPPLEVDLIPAKAEFLGLLRAVLSFAVCERIILQLTKHDRFRPEILWQLLAFKSLRVSLIEELVCSNCWLVIPDLARR